MSSAGGAARSWLLVAPGLAVALGLFAVPFGMLVVVSFWSVRGFRLQPDLTLAGYARIWTDLSDVLAITLGIALMAAIACVVIGFAFAYATRFHAGRWADAVILATLVTLFGGYLVKIYAWKSILGADGAVNALLLAAGLVSAPVGWLIYSPFAVVVTFLHFQLPFAFLPIYASLREVRAETLEAARDLGASELRILARIVLPACRGGLAAAFGFCFVVSAGDYVTPQFLGGTSATMLGQIIAIEFGTRFNWPSGAAMSVTLLACCLLTVGLAWWLVGAPRRRRTG